MFLGPGLVGRFTITVLLVAALYNFYHFSTGHTRALRQTRGPAAGAGIFSKEGLNKESLLLNEDQCQVAFPLLAKEIDDAVAGGSFQFNRAVDSHSGQTHCRIKDGKLYIIATSDRASQEMIHERDAVLNQIQRALQTSPTPLPNIVFTISVLDTPRSHTWSFSRASTPNDKGEYWLMPHFSFWSWPKPFIGTIDQALSNIEKVEQGTPWEKKIGKAVWRGTVWFNSISNLNLRPKLLQTTKGKDWADVEEMKWENQGMTANNSIAIHDFCKYKYILYTEGVTYSGRLPFHQACESVILSTPPNFLLHNTHFMRPLFSSTLGLQSSTTYEQKPDIQARWPKSYTAPEANIVFVDPNWQDLEETIMYLEAHPNFAKSVARRQRQIYFQAGYLSTASEVCYWRALIRGWSSVAQIREEEWKDDDGGIGMRWETFTLKGTMDKTAI